MQIFDAHCHLDDEKFNGETDDLLQNMQNNQVIKCTTVGSDMPSSLRCLALATKYPQVYAACGVHPHEAKDVKEDYLVELEHCFSNPKVVALGEIGLDYYYDLSPRDVQKKVLIEQMQLANTLHVPVIFHIRDAHGDMLQTLKNNVRPESAVIHCFSGSCEVMQEYLKMGYYISFAGPLTFKNAKNLLEAAKNVPLDRVLVETDSPYLSPEPFRGKRNEPKNVFYVLKKLAEIKEMPFDEVANIVYNNTCTFYKI